MSETEEGSICIAFALMRRRARSLLSQVLRWKSLTLCLKDVVTMTEYDVTEYNEEHCTVRIHIPILSEEERRAREEEVKKSLIKFYKEMRSK
jgi:hypothetical protein